MHRFQPNSEKGIPILLVHGSIEDSRIFHSSSGKGLAPYLAKRGFDVFAPDLPGKGKSVPPAGTKLKHSQSDFIHRDLGDYLAYIRTFYPGEKIRFGAHSWGGVLILAWYAEYGKAHETGNMVFFGSKRRIAVKSARRFFAIDLMWSGVGQLTTALAGYLPAKKLRFGSANEPAQFYLQTNKWVYSVEWTDPETGKNIPELLRNKKVPPILYFAAIKDHVLGNPSDVEKLMNETGSDEAAFVLLAKHNGNARDYNHIDMLTAPECPEDHFPLAEHWLKTGNLQ
jgi:predicted alpha/beta hydrolase